MFLICKWKGQFLVFLFTRWLWGSPEKTDLEELWNDNLHLCDTGITPLTRPSEMHRGQLPWVTRRGGPCAGEHRMQVLALRGHRTTGVHSDKHLNIPSPAPFRSKFPSNVITTCKLFMPLFLLNQPVKFSCQSFRILKKVFTRSSLCFPSAPWPVQITMDLYPSETKIQRPWLTLCESARPPNPAPLSQQEMLSADCVPVAWSCTPWYHTSPEKDGCLNQHPSVPWVPILSAVFLSQDHFLR